MGLPRLTRYTQSIFGSTAGANEMAQYGSFAQGSPTTYSGSTITPTIVQSLAAYLSGWFTAVEGAFSPAIEDMNALCFLFGYQLSYLMQAGIPEWDSGTTYFIGDLAQVSGVIYTSLTDNNTNNAVTDSTKWFSFPQAGSLTIDTLPYTSGMTLPANQTLSWPNLNIGNSQTVVVPNSAYLLSGTKIVISGTGVLQATGTGIIRIF